MRVVTGDVDIVEYYGYGTSPRRFTRHTTISDIIIGESCDMEMESGGEVGTLVSWHTVAPGDQALSLHTPLLRVSRQITILYLVFISCLMSRNVSHTAQERGK